jgi:hypothetical protein
MLAVSSTIHGLSMQGKNEATLLWQWHGRTREIIRCLRTISQIVPIKRLAGARFR